MKKILIFLFILSANIYSQYTIQSPYLAEPEKMGGFADSCAAFWMNAWDNDKGGFYTNIGKTGSVNRSWGTQKNLQTQSRNAYGLIRAYMMTGKKQYLQRADEALRFMYESAWDNRYGGWYWEIDENGNPINPNGNKDAFHQHYAMLGIAAMCEATGSEYHREWLDKGYDLLINKMWDNDCSCSGYYDYADYDWSDKHGKSFNSTVDAITTHLLSMFEMTGDSVYLHQGMAVARNILDYFVPSLDNNSIGFAEEYDNTWNPEDGENMTLAGHVLKAGWCLGRMYRFYESPEYIPAAEKLLDNILDNGGYDFLYGGPYKDFNRFTGEMLMWGNPDTAKAWWQMEQAITSGLEIYDLTGDEKYLQMADESLDFFMKYFVDHVYGEVYENRTRQGGETWGEHKGNGNKAGYHSIETAFYVYLYGNLFLHNEPVSLYYDFKAVDTARTVKLTPLAIEDIALSISGVTLDGEPFEEFDGETRTLNIAAGQSGEFYVTFTPAGVSAVTDEPETPLAFTLEQNYPNPFNPATTISFELPERGNVSLKVYDVLGREVAVLAEGIEQAGKHTVNFGGSELAGGVYIYNLVYGGKSVSKKMILLK